MFLVVAAFRGYNLRDVSVFATCGDNDTYT